jgi:hypothetical protein
MTISVMDPTAIVNPTEPLLRNRTTSGGASIWCTGDPVHLSRDAYKDLAMAVQEAHEGADMEGESASVSSGTGHLMPGSGSGSRSSSYGTEKRRTPDAVVTMSIPETPKRGRYARPPATAGWLCGVSSRVHGASVNPFFGIRGANRGRTGSARGHSGQRGQYGHWAKKGRGPHGRRW